MNIFVAGIHGVGKTFLASQVPSKLNLIHTSASRIIKDELSQSNWSSAKLVGNINVNQDALLSGINRLNAAGKNLLLDGHFVLQDRSENFVKLDSGVFSQLSLRGVILLEANPRTIAERIKARDDRSVDVNFLETFSTIERQHATDVCRQLNLSLRVLREPTSDSFNQALTEVIFCNN